MSLDPNKTYYLVEAHSGKGLSYEVYASYDYVREVEGPGTPLKFENLYGGQSYKIIMTAHNWSGYKYLTISGKNWIYLDSKDNATIWELERDNEGDLTLINKKNISGNYWRYYESGSKKWLGTGEYSEGGQSPTKRFKIIAAD
ncbi:hypothetical protein [Priestia megaterium]|uniref:hypothetical protein n=1 Tax=Priestia megaterium TaxID=1404 RepID=UPI000BF95401|nr:hypothetical protein [Priestia megaterium]PFW47035.1 hypothetical protein COL17_22240 [Priestia megaterium]